MKIISKVDSPRGDEIQIPCGTKQSSEYKIRDFRIKTLPFLNREEYINELSTSDVFLSCSRSEGWNLPLIEAMACGIPSIYSNCSGQLEFAKGKGHPIDIIGPDSSKNFYVLFS